MVTARLGYGSDFACKKTLKVWDVKTGRELSTLQGHAGSVSVVSVTPDGLRAVSGSGDKTLKVWDLEKGEEMARFSEDGEITAVAQGADGKTLVARDLLCWGSGPAISLFIMEFPTPLSQGQH